MPESERCRLTVVYQIPVHLDYDSNGSEQKADPKRFTVHKSLKASIGANSIVINDKGLEP